MMRDKDVRETPTSKLMKMAYYMFNFASVQSYKWKFNKGEPPDVCDNYRDCDYGGGDGYDEDDDEIDVDEDDDRS